MIYLISLSSFKEYLSFYPYSSWVLPRKKDVWQKLCHQENGSILGFEGNTRPKAEWQCACHGPFAGGLQSSIFLDLTVGLTPEPGIPLSSRNGICSQHFLFSHQKAHLWALVFSQWFLLSRFWNHQEYRDDDPYDLTFIMELVYGLMGVFRSEITRTQFPLGDGYSMLQIEREQMSQQARQSEKKKCFKHESASSCDLALPLLRPRRTPHLLTEKPGCSPESSGGYFEQEICQRIIFLLSQSGAWWASIHAASGWLCLLQSSTILREAGIPETKPEKVQHGWPGISVVGASVQVEVRLKINCFSPNPFPSPLDRD